MLALMLVVLAGPVVFVVRKSGAWRKPVLQANRRAADDAATMWRLS